MLHHLCQNRSPTVRCQLFILPNGHFQTERALESYIPWIELIYVRDPARSLYSRCLNTPCWQLGRSVFQGSRPCIHNFVLLQEYFLCQRCWRCDDSFGSSVPCIRLSRKTFLGLILRVKPLNRLKDSSNVVAISFLQKSNCLGLETILEQLHNIFVYLDAECAWWRRLKQR